MIGLITPILTLIYKKGARRCPHLDISTPTLRLFLCSAIYLLLASSLCSGWQIFYSPIHCACEANIQLDQKYIDSVCWVSGLHTEYTTQENVMARGINPLNPLMNGETETKKEQNYYQWLVLTLSLQGMLFLFPYSYWVTTDLFFGQLILKSDKGLPSPERLTASEIALNIKKFSRQSWKQFLRYLICITVGLVLVVLQFVTIDYMVEDGSLGFGAFLSFGIKDFFVNLIGAPIETSSSSFTMAEYLFPISSKCDVKYYNAMGNISNATCLCVLTMNEFFRKIYLGVWFAMCLLLIACAMSLMSYLVYSLNSYLRFLEICGFEKPNKTEMDALRCVLKRESIPTWFVLSMLKENLDILLFWEVIHALADIHNKSRKNYHEILKEEDVIEPPYEELLNSDI